MNSTHDVEQRARQVISEMLNSGATVGMEWAVEEIIQSAGTLEGTAIEFYRHCAHEYVYRIVKKVVDKYDADSEEDQPLLSGFEYIHVAYSVLRNGERVLVPTGQLTSEEILKRASEYESQAHGLNAHAQELRLYVHNRQEANH